MLNHKYTKPGMRFKGKPVCFYFTKYINIHVLTKCYKNARGSVTILALPR